MKFFIVLLLAYAAWASPSGDYYREAGVYWRDYDGNVPRDAIDASGSSSGSIYVGQGYFKGVGLLPGTLRAGSANLKVTERGNLPSTNKNVRILCSKDGAGVRWLKVNYADLACLRRIGGIKMVSGGIEQDVPVFIGRRQHEGQMQVGKVYTKAPYDALHLLNKNGGATPYKDFEILVYV